MSGLSSVRVWVAIFQIRNGEWMLSGDIRPSPTKREVQAQVSAHRNRAAYQIVKCVPATCPPRGSRCR
jgi:hypothetical protein